MKKSKLEKQADSVTTSLGTSVETLVETPSELVLNNKAFGLVVSNGQFKIVEVPFNSESGLTGSLSVVHSLSSRDEAQERFRILVARNVFTQGLGR